MMKTVLFAMLALGCGDNNKTPDGGGVDAPPMPIPPKPQLGAQIDRMGRPAISTALNHVFDTDTTTKTAAKDAYNAASMANTWVTTFKPEFASNLPILDALDKGLLPATTGVHHCSATTATVCVADVGCPSGEHCISNACGNQALYNGKALGEVGVPNQCFNGATYQATCSYNSLASVLADDELYLDTSKTRCKGYLAVEFGSILQIPYTDCGGRAPDNDVMDSSYSALAAGLAGFDITMDPPVALFGDTVGAHMDVNVMKYPYFGNPH